MSRSRKKTPISGIASHTGTPSYKRLRAGQERARLRTAIDGLSRAEEGEALAAELGPLGRVAVRARRQAVAWGWPDGSPHSR